MYNVQHFARHPLPPSMIHSLAPPGRSWAALRRSMLSCWRVQAPLVSNVGSPESFNYPYGYVALI